MHVEYVDLTTDDGYRIVARIFSPALDQCGVVVIGSAMGVAQEFYAPLAHWLASHGYRVVSFDYRGVGQSLYGPLRGLDADILTWARQDSSAALQAGIERADDTPVYWLGHSLGGQIVPFLRDGSALKKIVTIAAGIGYWRVNPVPLRYQAAVLWYLLVPLLVPLFGYFPGSRLRAVGDLPAGVILQWRRWCLDPRYSIGVEGPDVEAEYAAVRAPIFSLSFEDDEMMTRRSIEALNEFYKNAEITMERIGPADVGVSHIGHFGYFRPSIAEPLWKRHLLVELS